ncbi:MAG TPA: hypothetical protein VMS43_10810 [Allosphingosinicella sp.]|nr:hypothetical protein [Allosphingosinicella sp.]
MSVVLALALAAAPATGCAGPRPGWLAPTIQARSVSLNRISFRARDQLLWNGVPITRQILRQYLDVVATIEPLPLTIVVPGDDVDCALLETVRDEIEAALPCAARVCGDGAGAWREEDLLPPPPPPVIRRRIRTPHR